MRVSIVTITYNRAHLIGETIQSVLNQTYNDFEHIIIDDGSTDDTEKVILEFNDPRIKYFKYEKQPLRSFLRNEGFRKASGELISLLDSDDLWMENKLETICRIFNDNPQVGFVIHNLASINSGTVSNKIINGKKSGTVSDLLSDLLADRLRPYSIFTISKNALEKIGLLDESMIDGQQDLYFRASSQLKIYFIDDVLTIIKKHDNNISKSTDIRQYDDYYKAVEKLKSNGIITTAIQNTSNCRIYHYKGQFYKSNNDIKNAKASFKRSYQSKLLSRTGIKSLINYLRLAL